jgi:ubiquinone/menaquinone biosynthesis C-methylase UbiE
MPQLEFDEEGLAQQLDAIYRTRDVVRRRRLVREAVAVQPGERILDVGCGPGYYVAELAEQVGAAGHVSGIDPSGPMLAVAARRCAELTNADVQEGDATSLPAGDADFDAVLSVQVFEYLPDVEAALAEVHRVLRPGGRVVLWAVDWSTVSMHARDRDRCERVLRAWDQHVADPVLPRTLAPRLRAAGFQDVRMEGHTFATSEFTPEAYGGSLIGVVEPFVTQLGHEDDARAWAAEQRELGEAGEFYFAVVQACFTARRA